MYDWARDNGYDVITPGPTTRPGTAFTEAYRAQQTPAAVEPMSRLAQLNAKYPLGVEIKYQPGTPTGRKEVGLRLDRGNPGPNTPFADRAPFIRGSLKRAQELIDEDRAFPYAERNAAAGLPGDAGTISHTHIKNGISGVISHEYGHAVHAYLKEVGISKARIDAVVKKIKADPPSGRALDVYRQNPGGEAFAEAFAHIEHGGADRWGLQALLDEGFPREAAAPALEPAVIRPATQTIDEIRAGEQVEMRGKQAEIKRVKAEQREMEAEVEDLRTIKLDPSFTDSHGHPLVEGDGINILKEQTAYVQKNSWAYQVERGPRVHNPWKPEDSHIAALVQDRSNLATVLFDYGPIAKVTQFMDFVLEPLPATARARDGRQMVANKMMPFGFSSTLVTDFFTALHTYRENARFITIRGTQYPLFRGIQSLTPDTINMIGNNIFGSNDAAMARFNAKYGGRFDHVLDESMNSLIRRADLRIIKGKGSKFDQVVKSGYWAWQNVPGLSTLADGTRLVSKFLYPLIRFTIDPRWLAMNYIEADIIAFGQDGFTSTRVGGRQPGEISEAAFNRMETRSDVSIPLQREGETMTRSANEAREDTGAILLNQNLNRVARNQFDARFPENTRSILDAIPEDGGVHSLLVEKFGPNKGTWAEQLDEMLYGFETKGVKRTIDDEFARVGNSEGWTAQEMTAIRPLMRALTDLHQKTYDDLIAVHVGNPNRSRLERLGNSYWLYWPLSYQIKATKWLVGVLSNRAGGRQTNLGGLWTVNRLHDEFLEATTVSPEFQQQLEDDNILWFTAGMLLPITPFDIGVSLNRGTRYFGANLLGLWPEYDMAPGDMALKMMELGPFYTANLLQRIASHPAVRDFFEEDDGGDNGGYAPPL
jgi:hypothetical protein